MASFGGVFHHTQSSKSVMWPSSFSAGSITKTELESLANSSTLSKSILSSNADNFEWVLSKTELPDYQSKTVSSEQIVIDGLPALVQKYDGINTTFVDADTNEPVFEHAGIISSQYLNFNGQAIFMDGENGSAPQKFYVLDRHGISSFAMPEPMTNLEDMHGVPHYHIASDGKVLLMNRRQNVVYDLISRDEISVVKAKSFNNPTIYSVDNVPLVYDSVSNTFYSATTGKKAFNVPEPLLNKLVTKQADGAPELWGSMFDADRTQVGYKVSLSAR